MARKSTPSGYYVHRDVGGEAVRAFVPSPLPPDPPLDLAPLSPLLEQAAEALGRLDGLASALPDPSLLIYLYIRKEAVLSSQIEGTQSSLADLLLFEEPAAPGIPQGDVAEVSRCVAALEFGLRRMREGFPLSLRLIREIHGVLLSQGRGSEKQPGEFRTSQNWIGGTRPGNAVFVPPPPELVMECMGKLELFLHEESELPRLARAALVHVQFETIHPFLDGNGRVGRLLITLSLCQAGMLREPLLYLSLYFKTHRPTYYGLLDRARGSSGWAEWVEFFLRGVQETAAQAAETAQRILHITGEDRQAILALGRPALTALRLHELLRRKPILSAPAAAQALGLSWPAAAKALAHLQTLGIVRETTGKRRHRHFTYERYLAALNENAGPAVS